MTMDKRTILSTKRARNKRQKASRAQAKALAAAQVADYVAMGPECDGAMPSPTGIDAIAVAAVAPDQRHATSDSSMAVHVTLQASNDGQDVQSRRPEITGAPNDDADEDDDCDDYEDLVFVCRPTMQDFCTEFVTTSQDDGSRGMRRFTVRIPAFRETRDGFTTYTITVMTCGDTRRQFQLERRYSEFVSFAQELDQYVRSMQYHQLRSRYLLARGDEETKASEEIPCEDDFRWELPPKTWFPMTQVAALEERRAKLEASLHSLLSFDRGMICYAPLIRDFLMLDIFGAQLVEEKLQGV
ncbi:hypothetical protein ATCC90586_009516 [Pythium insidiosum]|nr:hypothetical protein ATCC90586_009516 [Pythium insidiosum]